MTKPSPPLLPRPDTIATRCRVRSGNADRIAATTCVPAFSISVSTEIPCSLIVRRSASRICADVSTRMDAKSERTPCARLAQEHEPPRAMTAVVYVNGKIADASHASVPVFDHGFLYGEGIYETLRT